MNTKLPNVPRGTLNEYVQMFRDKCSTWNILDLTVLVLILSGFIQGILAIGQFFNQSSIGFFFLKESLFSTFFPGVAKVIINETVLVRSYGLFPHPNILAFFLGITILVTMSQQRVFLKMFHVEHLKWVYRLILGVQFFGFLLAFSKSAILGLCISLIYLFYKMFHVEHNFPYKENVPRGTFGNTKNSNTQPFVGSRFSSLFKMFHVEHLAILGIGIFLALFLSFQINWYYFLIQPFRERIVGLEFLNYLFQFSLIHGTGIGQYVVNFTDFLSGKSELWQLQPIHNLFLLILAETGLIGGVLFLYFILKLLYLISKNVPRGTFEMNNQRAILALTLMLFFIVVSQFDHYLWDIEQGQWMLWFVLGLAAASTKISILTNK